MCKLENQILVNLSEWAFGLFCFIVPSVVLFLWARKEKNSGYGHAERMDLKLFIQGRKTEEI